MGRGGGFAFWGGFGGGGNGVWGGKKGFWGGWLRVLGRKWGFGEKNGYLGGKSEFFGGINSDVFWGEIGFEGGNWVWGER